MYSTYAHIIDGEIKALNVKRGGSFNGKKLGSLSPDSTYAEMGLFPIIGERPAVTDSQKVTGPTYEWDPLNQVVNKIYVIIDIPEDEILSKKIAAKYEALKNAFETYITDNYSLGTQGTMQAKYSRSTTDEATKAKAEAVWAWIESVQAYYLPLRIAIEGGAIETEWDFSTFDVTKPDIGFKDFVS